MKKETIPYPICFVVAVFKMLIRILNTLRSRIWDMILFLFSSASLNEFKKQQIVKKGKIEYNIYYN